MPTPSTPWTQVVEPSPPVWFEGLTYLTAEDDSPLTTELDENLVTEDLAVNPSTQWAETLQPSVLWSDIT